MVAIVISSGHGKYIRGAAGPSPWGLDEVDEARKVVEKVAEHLRAAGVEVDTFHDNTSHDQSTNLHTIVAFHNEQDRDLDVSVHFNAYQSTSSPMGTECLYVTQQSLADKVAEAVAGAGGLIDRGPKKRTDLYFLNNTEKPAILIETCFVDSHADADLYREHFDEICRAIAETIGGVEIPDSPQEPPEQPGEPIEPGPPGGVRNGTVAGVPPGDVLNIRASPSSSAVIIGQAENDEAVTVIGEQWTGSTKWLKLCFGISVEVYGWASATYIVVEGGEPDIWHEQITATVFGHAGDQQEGAYGDWIDENTVGVSFPYKWRDSPRPRAVVKGPEGETTVDVVDVGPWNTDDPEYVLGRERPLAETQFEDQTRAQNGQVPTNDAGIDLTQPVAERVGISGKGKVSWRFA